MMKFLNKLVDSNDREVRKLEPFVERTNALEPETTALTDAELAGKTDELRGRLRDELGDLLVPIELREAAEEDSELTAENPALLAERRKEQRKRERREIDAALDAYMPGGLRRRARGDAPRPGQAPLRRPADGRHRAPPGRDRRDEDRRGQDARRAARRLPQRARPAAASTS